MSGNCLMKWGVSGEKLVGDKGKSLFCCESPSVISIIFISYCCCWFWLTFFFFFFLTIFLGLADTRDLSSDIGGFSALSSLNDWSSGINSFGGGYNIFFGLKLCEKGFNVAFTNWLTLRWSGNLFLTSGGYCWIIMAAGFSTLAVLSSG